MTPVEWAERIEGTDDYRTTQRKVRGDEVIEAGRVFNLSVPRLLTWYQSRHDPRALELALWHDEWLLDPEYDRYSAAARAIVIGRENGLGGLRSTLIFFAMITKTVLFGRKPTKQGVPMSIWNVVRRRQEMLVDQERVTHLVMMRRREQRGLTEQDYVDAARAINVPPHHLNAIFNKESRGSGFDDKGRLKILFEPHVVSRNTGRKLDNRLFPWVYQGKQIQVHLSYRRWKKPDRQRRHIWHPYYESPDGQWEMLAMVYALHPDALKGASFGGPQVLGETALDLGFHSPLEMIEEMYQGHQAQMGIAIRVIRQKRLVQALRVGDWETVERRYNGGGQNGAWAADVRKDVKRLASVYA